METALRLPQFKKQNKKKQKKPNKHAMIVKIFMVHQIFHSG